MSEKVSKITIKWDDKSDLNNIGWYCVVYDENGEEMGNSMNISFIVEVDEYGADEKSALIEALREEYPGAEIIDLD